METIEELKNGIPINSLDPTISDAILVTRELGLSYLWVDALCILQDKNAKEWNEEASRMNDIYGGSTVTLIVANAGSVKEGFLKEREMQFVHIPWSAKPTIEYTDETPSATAFFPLKADVDEDQVGGRWGSRGWTMQEGLLPRRLLHYTSSQMIWKCCEERRSERGAIKSVWGEIDEVLKYDDDISFGSTWFWGLDLFLQFKAFRGYLPSDPQFFLTKSPELFNLWYRLIENYSCREFTDENDRLRAISGLAEKFAGWIRNDEYVAGLWNPDIIRGLIWHIKGVKLIPRRSSNSTFPSWSWASAGHQAIKFGSDSFEATSRIKDVNVKLVNPEDPFSDVKSGKITIIAPLKKLSRLYVKDWRSTEGLASFWERYFSSFVEAECSEGLKEKYASSFEWHFVVLQMGREFGNHDLLILEATSPPSDGINEYHRVGVHTLLTPHESDIASSEVFSELKEVECSLEDMFEPSWEEKPSFGYFGYREIMMELERDPWEEDTVIIV